MKTKNVVKRPPLRKYFFYKKTHVLPCGKHEESADLEAILSALERGTVLHKVRSAGAVLTRRFYLDKEHEKLVYYPSHKSLFCSEIPHYSVRDISEVRRGYSTDVFHKVEENRRRRRTLRNLPIKEELCFSLVFSSNTTLDLIAPNSETCIAWCRALSHISAAYRNAERREAFDNWIKVQFMKADENENEALNFEECLELLKQMNHHGQRRVVKNLFDAANRNKTKIDGEDALDKEEFVIFYNSLLERPEVGEVFNKYKAKNSDLMGPDELQKFLKKEQGEILSVEECAKLIEVHAPKEWGQQGHLNARGFEALLLSSAMDIFNYQHSSVYQDMGKPLSHYYIAASHNTYLLQGQLMGSSSVEGYINALKRGCRCIELDVWDGANDEPVIFHGYTLTTKILFKDVIEAINEYSFVTSPYPVVLSIENHCTIECQVIMAKYLKEILGDKLHSTPIQPDETYLPSPEDLMYKILVKGKKLKEESPMTLSATMSDLGNLSDSSEISDPVEGNASSEEDRRPEQNVDIKANNEEIKKSTSSFKEASRKLSTKSYKEGNGRLTQELSDLVNYFQASQFTSFKEAKDWNFYKMSSFSETKVTKLLSNRNGAEDFVGFNQVHLSRIYPKGSRTSSSNYDPITHWNVGSQIVALNYQTMDQNMFYNLAKFAQNGNCGYILKPSFLRDPSMDPVNPPLHLKRILTIKIITGQHIPKPDESLEGEIVDPYVIIKIIGHPSDSQMVKTGFVKNNGFNPSWGTTFELPVNVPDLAMVILTVKDDSRTGKNLTLGRYVLPFSAVKTGYRHVHLRNHNFEKIVPATIFVHVTISKCNDALLKR